MSIAHPSADQFADLRGGIRICYRTDGDPTGEPLVLIAGLNQQLTVWPQRFVDGLVAEGYYVVRLDNRDAGRSSKLVQPAPGKVRLFLGWPRPDAYTLGHMAGDVVELLDHLDLVRVHLVGQSMGGMIAQTVAAHVPGRVASLVSIYSTTGDPKVGQASLKTKLMLARRAARNADEAAADHLRMTRHVAGRGYPIDENAERAYATNGWARADGGNDTGMARQIQAIIAAGDRTAEVATITAPTLVINGDRDPLVHPSGGRTTAQAVAGSRHVVVPGMGHHIAPGLLDQLIDLIARHTRSHRMSDCAVNAVEVDIDQNQGGRS
ncbi:alpha/beta fold hydrolase [Streptomyces viridiviolaceus]